MSISSGQLSYDIIDATDDASTYKMNQSLTNSIHGPSSWLPRLDLDE